MLYGNFHDLFEWIGKFLTLENAFTHIACLGGYVELTVKLD